jgi:hypothetical protein
MPDDGASMKDAARRIDGRPSDAGADHGTRERVQREPMGEYEIDERKRESATVIERAGGEGRDDGTDQAAPNLDRDSGDGSRG